MAVSPESLIKKLSYQSEEDRAFVRHAFEVAEESHRGQIRKSGEPYIIHPLWIAETLADMQVDPKTIAAALLHDTLEDTDLQPEVIEKEFGKEVLFLVQGVTKLGNVRYHGSDRHNESLRRLFVATSQDIRTLIVKLVDRLHNMNTLGHVPKEKQERIARETLEIYVPVAHRLGIGKIRKELEDLAFPYVYPEDYARVLKLSKEYRKKSEEILEKSRKALQKNLANLNHADIRVAWRVKGIYSLYKKLQRKHWEIDNVHDLLAIRVIVNSMEECYQVLGIIHELWRPMPGRIKDYIAFPKPNGYRSLHTTVITPYGRILEVQIRTEEMHRDAEFGIASHLMYKEKQLTQQSSKNTSWFDFLIPKRRTDITPQTNTHLPPSKSFKVPKWVQDIATAYSDEAHAQDFKDNVEQDFFSMRIFVFSPIGDVVDLPKDATPIDFAYSIHSDIGDHATGVKVNNKLVSLDTPLKNGDRVEIITGKKKTPTKKWLQFVKTSTARRRVRSLLNESSETHIL